MDGNDDFTIQARVKNWDIFTPDWDYLGEFPTFQLNALCGLSVGLHPYFASPSWVFNIAIHHFNGTDPDEFSTPIEPDEGARRAEALHEFLKRIHIAVGNLLPLGELPFVIERDTEFPEQTRIRTEAFLKFANSKGWSLPDSFLGAMPGAVTATIPAPAPKVEAIRGITKDAIISAFEGLHFSADRWSKNLASPRKWLADCRVALGNKSTSALWNPADIALALLDKGIPIKKLDAVFVHLKDWAAEWREKTEYERD